MEFAQHVVARLGQKPDSLKPANYILSNNFAPFSFSIDNSQIKKLIGADIFIDLVISDPSQLAEKIQQLNLGKWQLQTISAKGLKVWPNNGTCQLLNDHWCCRFLGDDITHQDSAWLLNALSQIGLNFIKLEHLYSFDGQNGFSLAQGE
jgi:isocitrate dehydrogenase